MRSVVVFAVVLCLALVGQVVKAEETVEELKEQIAALQARVKSLEKELASAKGEEEPVDDSHVVVLDGSNFDAHLAQHDVSLIEFYAPWCGHCKALAPEYARAAQELAEKQHAGVLAKVDCTAEPNKALCEKYKVQGFPTVQLFRKGADPVDYNGERSGDAISKYMQKFLRPAVSELSSVAAVDEFAADEPTKVVAFLGASDAADVFSQVAEKLRTDFSFGATRDAETIAHFKATTPSVFLFRDFDEKPASLQLSASTSEIDIVSFLKSESFPALGEIGPSNYMRYVERGLDFVWVFYDPDTPAQLELIDKDIKVVAEQYKTKLSFVKLDGKVWGEHAKALGLGEKLPGVVIETLKKHRHFVFDENTELTVGAFSNFVRTFLEGGLKAHVKSEPEPAANSDPVKVVVGTTYDKIVLDDSKDVLVEWYAPWCGHCKSLAPIYDELAAKYANDPNVVIAKVDATANDTPEDVQGFPTLKFFPAGDKSNPIDYSGDRSVSGMEEFIEANRKTAKAANKEEL